MAWKSYLYYFTATFILTFLITQSNMLIGSGLALIHIVISFRLAQTLYTKSFPLKDCLIIGLSFPFSIIMCFAAIYYQQGVSCDSQITKNILSCLKVSMGNFIGHLTVTCQASGNGEHVAAFEPYVGVFSISIATIFINLVFIKKIKEANKS